jgi:hypothetical protein
VPVRFDPFDVGTAYAFVNNRWAECHSEYYTTFQSHSERELQLATEALHKRRKNHSDQTGVTAKKLAEFLESVENEENVLTQRLSDLETRSIYSSAGASVLKPQAAAPSSSPDVPPESAFTGESPAFLTYGEM